MEDYSPSDVFVDTSVCGGGATVASGGTAGARVGEICGLVGGGKW